MTCRDGLIGRISAKNERQVSRYGEKRPEKNCGRNTAIKLGKNNNKVIVFPNRPKSIQVTLTKEQVSPNLNY